MTGTLGLFSLVDLIQLLSGARRSGRLLVQHPHGDAKLYFEEGEIVHAVFGEATGEAAVYALFADERGPFSFAAGLPAMERSIELRTQNLVLEAVRRLDEARRDDGLHPVPYEPDMVPERTGTVDPARVTLGAGEHAVLAHVDGRRSLQRIADLSDLPVDEVSRIVGRLVAADVLVVRKRRPRTARLVVRRATGRIDPGTGEVDASIVESWTRSLGRRPREVVCRREDGRVLRFRLSEQEGAGPFLSLGRITLLRSGLTVDEVLLVRPFEEDA
jgi:hypothetical protein